MEAATDKTEYTLDEIWVASKKHICAMIEEYTQDWRPNGPSEHVARAIMAKIRAMPIPRAQDGS